MNKHRVLHFGYSANLGGVEVFIKNLIMNSSVPQDIVVTTQDKVPFEDELSEYGTRFLRIPPRRENFFAYQKNIDKLLKDHPEYNIIHCHLNTASSIEPVIVAKKNKRKAICHSHSVNAAFGKRSIVLHRVNRKRLNRLADVKLACSKEAGIFMFEKEFSIVPNGINIKKFKYNESYRVELRKEFDIAESDFVILHVGDFSPRKNQMFLIDCFEKILTSNSKSKMVFVGKGGMMQDVKDKANTLGILDKIVFAGVRTDVYKFYSMADVFVMPSLFEGFGIVALEAQAAGLPTIVSEAIPSFANATELIKWKSLNASVQTWADTVLQCAKEHKRQNTYDSIVKAGFDISNTANKLTEIYLGESK